MMSLKTSTSNFLMFLGNKSEAVDIQESSFLGDTDKASKALLRENMSKSEQCSMKC